MATQNPDDRYRANNLKPGPSSNLTGTYFHVIEDGITTHQGQIVAQPHRDICLVEWLSWRDGTPTHQSLIPIRDMLEWRFYCTWAWANLYTNRPPAVIPTTKRAPIINSR